MQFDLADSASLKALIEFLNLPAFRLSAVKVTTKFTNIDMVSTFNEDSTDNSGAGRYGAFSSDPAKSVSFGPNTYLPSERCYASYAEIFAK